MRPFVLLGLTVAAHFVASVPLTAQSRESGAKGWHLAGLRSGFVVGPPGLIAPLTRFRNTTAPQVPVPVMEASAAAWAEETHVEEMRARYRERFAIARRLLGNHRAFRIPGGSCRPSATSRP